MGISLFDSKNDAGWFHRVGISGLPQPQPPQTDISVVVVGGGPTGLFLAHLLSCLGVKCVVVERYADRLGAPKAHALSPRTLEICRQFHLDVAKIRQLGTKRKDAYWVNFLTNLSGQSVGVLPYERMDVEVLEHTPEMIHNIPQPVFEGFMADVLGTDPNVEIRKGLSFVSLEETSDALVTTTVEETATGQQFRLCSRYVVACDGARSRVRGCLGIDSDGEDSYETMMTIHFNADLRPIVGERVGMLHWMFDPLAAGFIIAYDLSGNAVLISNFDAERHPVESWDEGLCRQVVTSALGANVPFDILSYRPWILSRKVAKSYRVGNVFLAGDAAHSFPPTGGLGLNCGLADVHNLAYKLAFLLRGQAGDSLLDTYESERRHVAVVNSLQSVKNGKQIFGLLKTLGTARDDLLEAQRNLYATLEDPEMKKKINEGVEAQREHFDNLELHIGYVYGDPTIPPHASRYTPKFPVGARLPHTWIHPIGNVSLPPVDVSYVEEFGPGDVSARRYSTLDLCEIDKFTLIVGRDRDLDVHISSIVKTCRLGRDFEAVDGPAGQSWLSGAGLTGGGGLLVRPDYHILMVLDAQTTVKEVRQALKQHLWGGQNAERVPTYCKGS